MYKIMMEEIATQAQEVMLHPLIPKPVQLNMEKEAIAPLLDKYSIHKKWPFGLKGPSLKEIIELLDFPKKTPFSVILATTIMANTKIKEELLADLKDSKIEGPSIPYISLKEDKVITPEVFFFGRKDIELLLKREIEECIIREELKNSPTEPIKQTIDEFKEEVIWEPEKIKQRVEVKERFHLLIEREDPKSTSNEGVSISLFTPSFEEGMRKEGERNFRELVYELVRGVQILKGNERIGLCLQLKSEEFDQMEILLVMDENGCVCIKFVVREEGTRGLILSGLNLLHKNLIDAGVNIKEIEVTMEDLKAKKEIEEFHIRSIPFRDLTGMINLVA